MNKKAPELHIVDGTKSRRGEATLLPSSIKKRIPKAEWLDDPDSFDKSQFIAETSDFLFTVYGIGSDQDKHTLAMLADHIELYVKCNKGIKKNGVVVQFNNGQTTGPNPFINVRNKTMTLIIQLMNEMGLTPRSRLSAGKMEEGSAVAQFLRGPFAS
ncbi:Putative phage terminase, small subunit, P27 family [uncultured Caudovirales phage]|uniref:Phage terminase, small subunit, P27 family n=1 Tax=uncultured Caudovirales phage TaxID=2100421 RepID=A0A6J5KHE1_9CAUD|nr:Putative phage terminase, small subunit, P27 family [uncultured Caudovirales phage]